MNDLPPPRKAIRGQSAARFAFPVLLLGNLCLAFGPWLVRLAEDPGGVGPVAAGLWRLALAAPMLLLLARREGPWPRGGVALTLLLGGLFFAADLALWHLGIERTKLANATLFGNVASFLFPLYGFVLARALPSRAQGFALAMAGAGALLLLGRSYELSPENLVGDLFCIAAGVAYTLYLIVIDRARRVSGAWPVLALTTVAGILPLWAAASLLGEPIRPADWTPLLLLALVSQVLGQGLMVFAMAHVRPLVVGLAFLTQPILAAIVGWFAYGEAMGLVDLVGAGLIAGAIVLVRRPALETAPEEGRQAA